MGIHSGYIWLAVLILRTVEMIPNALDRDPEQEIEHRAVQTTVAAATAGGWWQSRPFDPSQGKDSERHKQEFFWPAFLDKRLVEKLEHRGCGAKATDDLR